MKKRAILKGLMVLVAMLTAHQGFAQEQTHTERVDMNTGLVVWTGSLAEEVANKDKFFFLVEFKDQLNVNDKELYVGARGDYGVQGILSSVGMRMQLITSTPETHFSGQPNENCYQFVSRIENSSSDPWLGDRMGIDDETAAGKSVYLDRSGVRTEYNPNNYNNFPRWQLNWVESQKTNIRYKGETESKTVKVNTYTIQNVETRIRNGNSYIYHPTYITVQNGKLVSTFSERDATKWIIVSEDDFEDAMLDVTWGEVDLGVFVMDATFGRDNKDAKYWEWSTNGAGQAADIDANGKTLDGRQLTGSNIHWHQRNQDVMINEVMLAQGEKQVWHQDWQVPGYTYETTRETIGTNVAGQGADVDHNYCRQNFAQYYAAEIYNEKNSLTQTLHGANIPNLIDGLYKLTAQALYYDDVNGKTNDGVAYFVVKREVLGDNDEVVEETTEYMPIKPMMNEKTLGPTIQPHSGVSAGFVFNNNEDAYLLTTFVEISGNVRLTIGIEQREARGWTVIGNVHFYAHGKQALMIDEDWGTTTDMEYRVGDQPFEVHEDVSPYVHAKWYDNYDYPSTVYYQRTFTRNAWNPICMPLSLTGRQVRQAFGADALVCGFLGQRNNDPDGCILFSRALDLDQDENMNKIVIKAGYPYIIYVTAEPQRKVPQDKNYLEVEVGNGQYNHIVKIFGDCYIIPGVIKERYTGYLNQNYTDLLPPKTVQPNGNDPNDDITAQDEDPEYTKGRYPYDPSYTSTDIIFKGSFYHEEITASSIHGSANPEGGSNDYWVITKGDMYHLTGARSWNIWATYAYLYRPYNASSPSKELTFAIDDGTGIQEIATHIEGLYFDNGQNVEDNDVYTLSGTKVGKGTLDTLPKGIYILNGRKYVKK